MQLKKPCGKKEKNKNTIPSFPAERNAASGESVNQGSTGEHPAWRNLAVGATRLRWMQRCLRQLESKQMPGRHIFVASVFLAGEVFLFSSPVVDARKTKKAGLGEAGEIKVTPPMEFLPFLAGGAFGEADASFGGPSLRRLPGGKNEHGIAGQKETNTFFKCRNQGFGV